jgi:hypothetical protein
LFERESRTQRLRRHGFRERGDRSTSRARLLSSLAPDAVATLPNVDFPDDLYLDFNVHLRPEEGNRAFFGRDVLQGLVDGIDDFVHERQPRWERRSQRVGAPVLLGCSPWVNDDKLI